MTIRFSSLTVSLGRKLYLAKVLTRCSRDSYLHGDVSLLALCSFQGLVQMVYDSMLNKGAQ